MSYKSNVTGTTSSSFEIGTSGITLTSSGTDLVITFPGGGTTTVNTKTLGSPTLVLSATTTAPPGSPTLGDQYVVPVGATGAWAGQDNDVATWDGAAWQFDSPLGGWRTWAVDDQLSYLYDSVTPGWMAESAADVRAAVEAAIDSNVFTDADHTKLNNIEDNAEVNYTLEEMSDLLFGAGGLFDGSAWTGLSLSYNDATNSVDGAVDADFVRDTAWANGTVLSGTQTGIAVTYNSTLNQASFVVASQTDENFTTTLLNKLNAIDDGATDDQTPAEIKAALAAATDSNILTDALLNKLNNIEALATADQTGAEIKALYEAEADTNAFTDDEKLKLANLAPISTAEEIMDLIAPQLTGGTQSGIAVSYNDAGDAMNFVVASQTDENFTTTLLNKLNAIEPLAEVNPTPAEILTALLTVDGAASLLDSDLLDGQEGAYYRARANHTGTQLLATISDAGALAGLNTINNSNWSGTALSIANGGTGATTASAARAALGVDAAGTDNSTNVTLAGTRDYITIVGQTITRNAIDLTADVTGDLPVAEGGTGASTALAARSNLGLVIGADVQAHSAVLDSTTASFTTTLETKLAGIAAGANLYVHPNHSGHVVSAADGATTIQSGVVTEAMLAAALATKVNYSAPSKFDAIAAPDADDDSANTGGNGVFAVGSVWVDVTNDKSYRCVDASVGSAVWIDETLTTGDLGTMALQDATSVNITGGSFQGSVNITGGTISGITDLAITEGGTGASDAATARANLGVDPAGTDNSTNVTLAGTPDYITIVGQVITRNLIDLTTDVTGDLPVAEGGTGASTATNARANLGLAIGSDVQAYDAALASIAGLTTSANQMVYTTAADTYATTSLTSAGRALLDDADATAQRTTLGLAIGTDVQAYDAGLQSISGLTTAADRMIYTTALDTYAVSPLTSFARTLLDDTSATVARATLGVDPAGTDNSTDVTLVTTSHDYLSILGQAITLGPIDLTADVTGDLPVADGGTGASDAITARANLGLVIGTDVQAYDATIVVDADIGSTVQAWSAVLDATTASFTTTDESKLDNIEANANNYSHPNHTGHVTSTGDGATVIANGVIAESMLDAALATKVNNTAPSKFDATVAPSPNDDDSNTGGNGTFAVGSVWIDVTGNEAYRCVDASTGAALWINTTLTTSELGTMAVQDSNNVTITGGSITGITNLAIADGGTDASTAAGARINLGLEIGVDVQAYSAVLSATTASFTVADESKLDLIEDLADVTDTANVTAAGAAMLTGATFTGALVSSSDDASNVSSVEPFTVRHTTTGTPGNGIGVGIAFETETAAANNEIGSAIRSISTDTTAASEDFDLVFYNMAGGSAATEAMRISSAGILTVAGASGTINGSTIVTEAATGALYALDTVGTAEIDDEAVTLAKLQHAAAWTLLLNNSASAGDPQYSTITALADSAGFGTGDKLIIQESSGELRKIDYDDLPGAGGATDLINDTTPQFGGDVDMNGFFFGVENATTNSVVTALSVQQVSSGTPAAGIGAGIDFNVETSDANEEIGMQFHAVTTDVTGGAEDFDFVLNLMEGGAAAAERFRVTSAGDAALVGALTSAGLTSTAASVISLDDASTNTVLYPLRVSRTSSGTPANNIGAGIEFEVETAGGNNEVGALLEAVAIDTTAASEDFNLRVMLMAGGAAATEVARFESTGNMVVQGTLQANAKEFDIKHPSKPGKRLRHGVLEGPEHAVYLRDHIPANGIIDLPEFWDGLVDFDSITVQLTPSGKNMDLYVQYVDTHLKRVHVGCTQDMSPNGFYFIQAERIDIPELDVEYDA